MGRAKREKVRDDGVRAEVGRCERAGFREVGFAASCSSGVLFSLRTVSNDLSLRN